jgi:hypothetical protein
VKGGKTETGSRLGYGPAERDWAQSEVLEVCPERALTLRRTSLPGHAIPLERYTRPPAV